MSKKEKEEKKIAKGKKEKKADKKTKKTQKSDLVKGLFAKKSKCDHLDFWSCYKIINFHRYTLKGNCKKCNKDIQLQYLLHDVVSKNILLSSFSCILWMSPAFLLIILASIFASNYGLGVYFIAAALVIIFHFWAMYYIIKGGSIKAEKQ